MRSLAAGAVALAVLLSIQFSHAQPAPAPAQGPAPAPGVSARTEAAAENRAAARKKRDACRQAGTGQGLSGPDLRDHVAVCVLEARLGCLKQAIGQKLRGPQRGAFMRSCLGS